MSRRHGIFIVMDKRHCIVISYSYDSFSERALNNKLI